jgi:23S rRNA pseudouridine2605 synthase/23S rRNA pseudouridine2604 synthase
MIRLQKYIAHAGVCSRRKAEHHIQNGEVKVNGKIVTHLGIKIDPESDRVEVAGHLIEPKQPMIYIMLNKPKGYITSCRHGSRKIVMDLIDIPQRVYPVGRLDKDSTGLLLLTNDGGLHLRLTHPSFDHEKEYEVEAAEPISDEALQMMRNGIVMDGAITRKSKIRRLSNRRFRMVLQEGKKRQIRRMVEAVGGKVTELHRIRVAGLRLGDLAPSQWRYLTREEIEMIKGPAHKNFR